MATTEPRAFTGTPTLDDAKIAAITEWYRTSLGDSDKASTLDDASYWQGTADALENVLALLFPEAPDAPLADVLVAQGGRRFELQRDVDVSGVSGTGVVADGIEFPDGTVSLRWRGEWPTSVVFHDRGMDSVKHIHGHGGATRVVYVD